jgi:hypothetical protein
MCSTRWPGDQAAFELIGLTLQSDDGSVVLTFAGDRGRPAWGSLDRVHPTRPARTPRPSTADAYQPAGGRLQSRMLTASLQGVRL